MDLNLPFPHRGNSDELGFSGQIPETSREAINVRGIDPKTGRTRGGQRSGMSNFLTDSSPVLTAGVGKDLISVTFSRQFIDFDPIDYINDSDANDGTTNVEWQNKTPDGGDVRQLLVSERGNVFAISGDKGVVVYNSDGVEIQKVDVPTLDDNHKVRAIQVDSAENLYVAIGADTFLVGESDQNGDQASAKIWKYERDLETGDYVIAWAVEPGGFVSKLFVRNGQLLASVNRSKNKRSEMVIFDSISTLPQEVFRRELPYPVLDFDLNDAGELYITCPPFTDRNVPVDSPLSGGLTNPGSDIDWQPGHLRDSERRIWCWLDASDPNTVDVGNASTIIRWKDKGSGGRDLVSNYTDIVDFSQANIPGPPIQISATFNGLDGIRFDRSTDPLSSGTNGSFMLSRLLGDSVDNASGGTVGPDYDGALNNGYIGGDELRTTFPDGPFVAFIVMSERTAVDRGILLQQTGATPQSLPDVGNFHNYYSVEILTNSNNGAGFGTFEQGYINSRMSYSGGDGYYGEPLAADLSEYQSTPNDPVIITVIGNSGEYQNSGAGSHNVTADVFRINGTPVDRHIGHNASGGQCIPGRPTMFGDRLVESGYAAQEFPAGPDRGDFDIFEILVLRADDRGAIELLGEEPILSHPRYGPGPGSEDAEFNPDSDTEMERIEGYLAHKWGIDADLGTKPGSFPFLAGQPYADYVHPYAASPPPYIDGGSVDVGGTIVSFDTNGSILAKYASPTGKLLWISRDVAGVGYGVRAREGGCYTTGPIEEDTGSGGNTIADSFPPIIAGGPSDPDFQRQVVRRYTDADDVPASQASFADAEWESELDSRRYTRHMDIDSSNNLYLAIRGQLLGSYQTFYVLKEDGEISVHYRTGASNVDSEHTFAVAAANESSSFDETDLTGGNFLVDAAVPQESSDAWSIQPGGVAASTGFSSFTDPLNGLSSTTELSDTDGASVAYLRQTVTASSLDNGDVTFSVYLREVSGTLFDIYVGQSGTETRYTIGRADLSAGSISVVDTIGTGTHTAAIAAEGSWYRAEVTFTLDVATATDIEVRIYAGQYTLDSETNDVAVYGTQLEQGAASTALTQGILSSNTKEFVYLGLTNDSSVTSPDPDETQAWKLALARTTQNQASLRQVQHLAIGGGLVKRYSADGSTTISSAELESSPKYVESTTLFEEVFITDGSKYFYYDPREGELQELVSTSTGGIPPFNRLITNWRGRLVLARSADDPHNWHMSALGEPRDWDQFPPVITATQAISGNNARAGRVPDIINSLIPYNDDLLIFGGDRSIWRLTGDPMAGGQMDLISDITGMAFGRPWAKDPEGRIYFFGSRGGVYVMSPAGQIERLSQRFIERRFQDFDLESYYVRMAWNYIDEGLHVFQIPFGSTNSTQLGHFFWDQKNNAWYQDEINVDRQPRAIELQDGDQSADRRIVILCQDGGIRYWDRDAKDDDGKAIDARVTFGPYSLRGSDRQLRWKELSVSLSSDQDGCKAQFFSSDSPDVMGSPTAQMDLAPGRNPVKRMRSRGSYCWLKLRNAAAGQRWAFENAMVKAASAGRKRSRII